MRKGAVTFRERAGTFERVSEDAAALEASRKLPRGAYTTLRTYGGRSVVRLAQHVSRLNETSALLRSDVAVSEANVRVALRKALAATQHPESRLRLTWAPPDLYVTVELFEPLPEEIYAWRV